MLALSLTWPSLAISAREPLESCPRFLFFFILYFVDYFSFFAMTGLLESLEVAWPENLGSPSWHEHQSQRACSKTAREKQNGTRKSIGYLHVSCGSRSRRLQRRSPPERGNTVATHGQDHKNFSFTEETSLQYISLNHFQKNSNFQSAPALSPA